MGIGEYAGGKTVTSKQPLADSFQPLPPKAAETLRHAIAAHQAGKFVEAESLYRRVLEVDAKQFPVLVMFGVLQGQVGKYAEAERLLGDAVKSIRTTLARIHLWQRAGRPATLR